MSYQVIEDLDGYKHLMKQKYIEGKSPGVAYCLRTYNIERHFKRIFGVACYPKDIKRRIIKKWCKFCIENFEKH